MTNLTITEKAKLIEEMKQNIETLLLSMEHDCELDDALAMVVDTATEYTGTEYTFTRS